MPRIHNAVVNQKGPNKKLISNGFWRSDLERVCEPYNRRTFLPNITIELCRVPGALQPNGLKVSIVTIGGFICKPVSKNPNLAGGKYSHDYI